MFTFEVNQIHNEDIYIYNYEHLSIIYVTDGEIQVFYHSLNKISHLKKGFCCIVPFDEYSYINALSGSVIILTLNYFLILTLANNIYPRLLSIDYSKLSYLKNDATTKKHLHLLAQQSPFNASSLNTQISFSIITILNILSKSINEVMDLTEQKLKPKNIHCCYHKDFMIVRLFEASVELLNNPQKSIAHIAIDYGFCDQAHFTKLFKKHRNMTPHTFRQQYAFYK
ncbi:helix-turn-helix domain-containing protein [Mammaliicoccus sp. G-M28]|uniref:helix-turn-helix domain-containing protein n=1 Tax=Mammaliicoccus sp. G-M28 TaxID=2898688 RepID=UPI001EFBD29B|nr:helix-turn-helix domain-containing protein [Mammaliicoccus sp. G-M28]